MGGGVMRQAIRTTYHGPTNARGSRIIARAAAGSKSFPWDYALDPAENHRAAALKYAQALGWSTTLQGGCLHDGSYAWTLADPADEVAA